MVERKIFAAYRSKDLALVKRICRTVELDLRVDVFWISHRDYGDGADYSRAIDERLSSCSHFVFFSSVKDEIRLSAPAQATYLDREFDVVSERITRGDKVGLSAIKLSPEANPLDRFMTNESMKERHIHLFDLSNYYYPYRFSSDYSQFRKLVASISNSNI